MLTLSGITKEYRERTVLKDVTLIVRERERAALVGANGAGKTTLLMIMADRLEPDRGDIVRKKGMRIGYLPQKDAVIARGTVWESCLSARSDLVDLKRNIERIEHALEHENEPDKVGALLSDYDVSWNSFQSTGGADLEAKASRILAGLGFQSADFQRDAGELSGGFRMRLALAGLLLYEPDLLLLDEPTNHLDLEARNWLADYLNETRLSFILVSHDRYFLDRTTDTTLDLAGGSIESYPCPYSRYVDEREERRRLMEKAVERRQEEIEKLQDFIRRFHGQPTKSGQVRDRMKKLEKMKPLQGPAPVRKKIRFSFPQPARGPRQLVVLEDAVKRYGDHTVFDDVDFVVERGDRIALVGANGAGKTTLMRILAGIEPLSGGRRVIHPETGIQYFSQDTLETLDQTSTLIEELATVAPADYISRLRTMLGGFLFHGDDVFKQVGVLSGGEMARLAMAKMLLRRSNLLLLDEPTNNLDIDSIEVLLQALRSYSGSIVFVSHDRFFINALAGKVAGVGEGKVRIWPGNYDAFLDIWSGRETAGAATPGIRADGEQSAAGKADWATRKKAKGAQKALERAREEEERKLERLEARTFELEDVLSNLETVLSDSGQAVDRDRILLATKEYQRVKEELHDLYWQWDEVSKRIEELRAEEAEVGAEE